MVEPGFKFRLHVSLKNCLVFDPYCLIIRHYGSGKTAVCLGLVQGRNIRKERKKKSVKTHHTLPKTKKINQPWYLKQYKRYCADEKKENEFFGSVL